MLVMEKVDGVGVGDVSATIAAGAGEELPGELKGLSKKDRNDIAAWIIELCLKELFEFRTMQTDPNWTNFLWNQKTRQVGARFIGLTNRTLTRVELRSSWSILERRGPIRRSLWTIG